MNKSTAAFIALTAFGVVLPAPVYAINNLELPQAPLTVQSNRVDPNVMLQIDNSGSMRNMMWPGDEYPHKYDPNADYDSDDKRWDDRIHVGGNYGYEGSEWNKNSGNVDLDDLRQDNCPDGYYEAVRKDNWKIRKCLALPDPRGGKKTRYTGHYLNFLYNTFPHGTDLRDAALIPQQTRMEVAKEVATQVIDEVKDIRFGVFEFNSSEGGTLVAECGSDINTLKSEVSKMYASTNTPLAETLYEVTRYFRGLSRYNGTDSKSDYVSPIQYRCQKNFTIIITDGEPTQDDSIPSGRSDDSKYLVDNRKLPNWDGVSPNDSYLDDMAKFGYETDMKQGGKDLAGVSWDDPDHKRQYMYTYTIGFTFDNQLLRDTVDVNHGRGKYFRADSVNELKAALGAALADISEKILSSSSSATSQGTLTLDTLVISPEYNSLNWSGDLSARSIDFSSGNGYQWVDKWPSAAAAMPSWSSRSLIYNKNGTGTEFRWGTFSDAEKTAFFNGEQGMLQYLRGRRDNEGISAGQYRIRGSALGDIVYSEPKYMGKPEFRYPDSMEAKPYSDFRKKWENRTEMVYVGANDGYLHAFRMSDGVERFAFMPQAVLPYLKELTVHPYEHRYYVDGSPTVVDAFVNNDWRTVLAGGMNRGGQSIYALDVTNPDGVSEGSAANLFMWEFTHAELGYTYSQPAIVKLNNGQWAAVFGNGYNSTDTTFDGQYSSTGNAVLFVVSLDDGSLIKMIDTGVGAAQDPTGGDRPNGLATTAPVDVDKDGVIDYVYAGDLFGNLWKFDLSGDKPGQWDVAIKNGKNTAPLFVACGGDTCTKNNRQPITVRPEVGFHPKGGYLVYFGTGKYIETADKAPDSDDRQTFYAVWDDPEESKNNVIHKAVAGRSVMHEQKVLSEVSQDFGVFTSTVRTTSRSRPDWSKDKGWYIDLPTSRERAVRNPQLRNKKIIFNTLVPILNQDPCKVEADSWLMELDATTGSRTTYAHFDLNQDSSFNSADMVSGVPPSGLKLEGDVPAPTIIAVKPDKEIKVLQDRLLNENPGEGVLGRQSWRQLLNQ